MFFGIAQISSPTARTWVGRFRASSLKHKDNDRLKTFIDSQGEEQDWGDAPDFPGGPNYRTMAANSGAYHLIDNVHFLGRLLSTKKGRRRRPFAGCMLSGRPLVAGTNGRRQTAVVDTVLPVPERQSQLDATPQLFDLRFGTGRSVGRLEIVGLDRARSLRRGHT